MCHPDESQEPAIKFMNKIYLIANWKMQLKNQEAVDLVLALKQEYQNIKIQEKTELILCPSFTALQKVGDDIKDSHIKLGAQNVFYHEKGAYTGEISPWQLKELGVEYVIVGHSERRQFLCETDIDVNLKIKTCLSNNLTPIMCIGETFEERRFGKTAVTLIRQITRGLEDVKLENNQKLIIAYEPVWVIGRGQAVESEEALTAAKIIKRLLLDLFPSNLIEKNINIIYGGSVDANNVKNFIMSGLLDGVLVGGASLDFEKFSKIIQAVI